MSNTSSRSNSLIPITGKQFDIISETGSIVSSEGPFDISNVIDLAIRMEAAVLPSMLELGNDVPIVEPIAVAVLVFYESYDLMQLHKDTLDKRKSILSQGTHLADHVMQKVNFANIGQFTSAKLVCYKATYCEDEEMRPATPGSPYLVGKELETAIIDVQNAPSNFDPPPVPVMASLPMEWEFDEMKHRITHAAMVVCDAGSILFDAKWSSFTKMNKYARINECIDRIQRCIWSCINLIRDVDQRIRKAMEENKTPHKFVERTRYSVTKRFVLNSEEISQIAECSLLLNQAVNEFIRSITKWNSLFYVSEREKDPRLLQIKSILRATTFDVLVKQHLRTCKYRKDWLHNEVIQWLSVGPTSVGNQEVASVPSSSSSSGRNNSFTSSSDNGDRLFWYRAGEGLGKSVFTAALVDRLNRYYPGQLLAVVFFTFNDTPQSRPVVVLRSLLYQLVRNIPELTESVLTTLEGRSDDKMNSADFIQSVVLDALTMLAELRDSAGACGNTVIVIDALDEAYSEGTEDRQTFLSWFTSFIASLPLWVKIFLTSRQQSDLMTPLTPFTDKRRRSSIDESDPRHVRDVQFYLNHIVVQTIPALPTPELGFIAAKEATQLLLRKSEGKFVYASIITHKIEMLLASSNQEHRWSMEQYKEFLNDLPDSISMGYMQLFNEIFKVAPLVKGMELLQVLVCVQEPLTRGELEDFLLMESVYSNDFNHLIEQFSEVFPLRDNVDGSAAMRFNASHRVLCDWLTDATQSGPYHCSPLKCQSLMAKRLLQKLQVECRLNEGCAILQDPVALSKRLSDYFSLDSAHSALKVYLFKYLLFHLDQCMTSDPKLRLMSYHLLTSPVWLRCHLQQVGLEAVWKEYDKRVRDEEWLKECSECREDVEGVEKCLRRLKNSYSASEQMLRIGNDREGETIDGSEGGSDAITDDGIVVACSVGGGYSEAWLDSVYDRVAAALVEVKEIRKMNEPVEPLGEDEEQADY